MTRWWKDFSVYQKVYGEKWVSYNATNEPIVCGHWQMVRGSIGPCVQPTLPNHAPIIIAAEALAPARHAAERQNGNMVKETRKKLEKLAGHRLVLAEMIKDCVEPTLPIVIIVMIFVTKHQFQYIVMKITTKHQFQYIVIKNVKMKKTVIFHENINF